MPDHGRYGYAALWDGLSWHVIGLPRQFEPKNVYVSRQGNAWIDGLAHSAADPSGVLAAVHWDGRWQQVPLPDPASRVVLAAGNSGAWAVDVQRHRSFYWNGTRWTAYPMPGLSWTPVFATGPDGRAWAFGTNGARYPHPARVVAVRWIPRTASWQPVSLPRLTSVPGYLAV